ncbi:MAG: hypothetical protein WBA12_12095 [Catalinimonas sp.]
MTKRKSKPKQAPDGEEKPRVHPELEGFEININSLGEVTNSFDIDKINLFLNRHVDDKKLRDRDDVPGRDDVDEEEELTPTDELSDAEIDAEWADDDDDPERP